MANLLLAVIYIAFISLGLPDAVLGAAWPTMSGDLHAPISWAGGISMTISAGTIVSALLSDRMTLRFGAGKVTAVSVALTAFALFGFSISPNYWMLLLFAIPYGLGAGGVDAALNNYVAIHYESRHMSWLHAMWGLGTLLGPYIMASALGAGHGWAWGYRTISILQVVLTAVLVLSLPLWKARKTVEPQRTSEASSVQSAQSEQSEGETAERRKPLGIRGVLAIRGAREILVMFFCYCALESTAMLWASSYMALGKGIDKTTAAMWGSLFCNRHHRRTSRQRFPDHETERSGHDSSWPGVGADRHRHHAPAVAAQYRHHRGTNGHRFGLRADLSVRHPFHSCLFRRGQIAGHRRHADGLRLCGIDVHAAAVRADRAACFGQPVPVLSGGVPGADGRHA